MPARFQYYRPVVEEYLGQKDREQVRREAYRSEIEADPQLGDRVSDIKAAYPWLTAGVVISLAKTGVPTDSPLVYQTAQLEFQRRSTQQDWTQPGDLLGESDAPTTAELFGEVTSAEEEAGPQEEGSGASEVR